MDGTQVSRPPVCWTVTDGKIGMVKQCVALAEAIGVRPVEKQISVGKPWRWLPVALWPDPIRTLGAKGDRLAPPWPDLLIATGRLTVAPALAVKRHSGGRCFCVQLQNPGGARAHFDLVIAPRHDRLRGDNVLNTLGALHGVTKAVLDGAAARFAESVAHLPRPLVAVLLGGPNSAYRFGRRTARQLCEDLARMAGEFGAGLLITPSRRTPTEVVEVLRARLGGVAAIFWDGSGENPYHGYLGLCDAVVVTEDSVNMVTEASGTGKPIHVASLEGGSAKFARFHEAMREAGICRRFSGALETWHYEPPNDTARAAAEVRQRMRLATV